MLIPFSVVLKVVDFALAHNKAFAVVPCCVFPEQFPDRSVTSLEASWHFLNQTITRSLVRRTRDGRPVVVTDDFIRYLMEKDSRIRLDYVPYFTFRSLSSGCVGLKQSLLCVCRRSWKWKEETRLSTCAKKADDVIMIQIVIGTYLALGR